MRMFQKYWINKANLRDLITVTSLIILLKFDPNHRFFSPCDLEIQSMTSESLQGTSSILHQVFCASFQIHRWFQSEETVEKRSIRVKNWQFFVRCDLKIWWMTLENNRAPLLYYIELYATFQNHGWIQIGTTVWKRSIQVKIGHFLSRVTFKFSRWPWKTTEHLFYVASSFVHNFIAISGLKLELQSGNTQFGSKWMFFVPCDLENWQMTLRNNRAPLLCYFQLCASFRSHW